MSPKPPSRPLRVVMTPVPNVESNQYVRLLGEALTGKGCPVALLSLGWRKGILLDWLKLIAYRCFRGYRILHIHWVFQFPSLAVLKLNFLLYRLLGLKIVWTVHNVIPHNPGPHDPARGRWLFRHADRKIVHYRSTLPEIEAVFGVRRDDTLHVIPLPIFDFYPNRIDPREARAGLSISEGKKVVLCFGEVRKSRGCEDFVEALKRLGDEYVGMIVGRPAHGPTVSRLVEEGKGLANLRLDLRYIGDEEVQIYFNACDAVVLPYTQVTTSGVAMLAFYFARPVVASRIGSLVEVVGEDMGTLVPPGDPEALAEGVRSIFARDPRAMGRRALEVTRQEYSWDRVAEMTARVYASLVE